MYNVKLRRKENYTAIDFVFSDMMDAASFIKKAFKNATEELEVIIEETPIGFEPLE